jgi:serine/threonine protein kinase
MAIVKQQDCETEYYHVGAMVDERYRLVQFIGAGGMACVYRAQEEGSPHEFAIKFLKSDYHNMPYLIEYFRDEASSMRDLAHPNIVRFYRFVNNKHYSYIIMDYVDGFALSDVIKLTYKKKEFLPLDEVVRVMTQVARALDAIHREGYIHRDIKPSNVLIDRKSGRAYLTDLGITSASNTRMEGAGTMAYMSPEQAETWVADHRSDVYSYGIMLFEMLSTHRPFRVESGLRGSQAEADLLRKHKEADVPDITKYRRGLPKELNTILQKGLAKTPEERYQSVLDFARDVHAILQAKLSADLQDFTQIQHRQIEAPSPEALRDDSQILRIVIGVGVIAILLAVAIALSPFIGGAVDTTPSPTAIPLPTSTIDPFPGAEIYSISEGINALTDRWDNTALILPALDYEALHYLSVGAIGGFRVRLNLASSEGVKAYGFAFRIQDASNYHYFAINPQNSSWQFVDVINGGPMVQSRGTLSEVNSELVLSGINRDDESIFVAENGDSAITYVSQQFATGSLAIYLVGDHDARLVLSELQIGLVGEDAQEAAQSQPTVAPGLGDPFRHLRHDVEAMIVTDDSDNGIVDCPSFIALNEGLDRHASNPNPDVQRIVSQIEESNIFVYEECRSQSRDKPYSFGLSRDYLGWEQDLIAMRAQLAQ